MYYRGVLLKIAYRAQNLIDAQLVKDQLAFQQINCRIQGEYLPGAMGGLPAMGLIHVLVSDDDYVDARKIIDEWEGVDQGSSGVQTSPSIDYIPLLLFIAVVLSAIVVLVVW